MLAGVFHPRSREVIRGFKILAVADRILSFSSPVSYRCFPRANVFAEYFQLVGDQTYRTQP